MKMKLEEPFGNEVLITSVHGKADVVTFKTTAAAILDKFYQAPKETNPEAEKLRIIETASKLTKNDICQTVYQQIGHLCILQQRTSQTWGKIWLSFRCH